MEIQLGLLTLYIECYRVVMEHMDNSQILMAVSLLLLIPFCSKLSPLQKFLRPRARVALLTAPAISSYAGLDRLSGYAATPSHIAANFTNCSIAVMMTSVILSLIAANLVRI